jgi:hypothetical protein
MRVVVETRMAARGRLPALIVDMIVHERSCVLPDWQVRERR